MLRLAIAGLLLTTTALAQGPSPQPAPPGRITGVVTTDAGLPSAGATVSITSRMSSDTTSRRSVVSDIGGGFAFEDVTPGAHRVGVSKPGLFEVGEANVILNGGRSVIVRPGEHVKDVSLTLARAGAIAGRVVDEFGEPVEQLEVYATRDTQAIDGQRMLLRAGDGDLTDDRGEFRVFGLRPGAYHLIAVRPMKAADGGFVANSGFVPIAGPLGPFETLPIYFPGTPDIAQAQRITIDAGQEASATFTWRPLRALRISGVVLSPPPLAASSVVLGTPGAAGPQIPIGANGSFVIDGVTPGDYTLSVRSARGALTRVPLSVGEADITDLVVAVKPPAVIRGRVTFNGTAPRGGPVPLRLVSSEATDLMARIAGDFALVHPDGQFTAETSASHVTIEPPSGWSVSSLTVGGTDALDSGIDLSDRAGVEDVRIQLTDKLTHVAGRVMADRGAPADDAIVLILRLDGGAAPVRSTLRTLETEADGAFQVQGLRRGSYVAAAIDAGEGPVADAAFLDRLRRLGQRFSLEDGQSVTLNLALTGGIR